MTNTQQQIERDPNLQVMLKSDTTNLLGLDRVALEDFFESIGEKKFRATQVMKWIHQLGVTDFQQMNNLSKNLRNRLVETSCVQNLHVAKDLISKDGTRKWLLQLNDGNHIEAVFIPEDDRGTLCVSSQVGCALDCSFCSTGRQGFNRNLTTAEIISQVWLAAHLLEEEKRLCAGTDSSRAIQEQLPPGRKITNVVMMGMGEPLLNFDNTISAVRIMMDDFSYGLSKRRVTVSTAGVVPAMDRLGDTLDMRLAVSLHAPNDALRDELVPINKKYPLKKLMAACRRFIDKQNTRSRITFEYVLLEGVNDKPEHARELIKLLKGIPTLMNLIPFNPFAGSGYSTSSKKAVIRFREILHDSGMTTVVRKTRGDDIDAACGQLAGKIRDKSRRHRRFEEPRFGME
ncbi:23S rRNA (adenine(2503)-C(2))-methyltransferase @ tRNA (adenine(37)-C(2))-methyltransferase [hydrothermal vent metagenome]|uniref:23S rRNA (Adenine(2503)-C(2))-methyltransferase @ tRNA (Adenine(37)-C(2))-methyltransferase n=1 Tax=hydrothermal vent metagenome TaxID=652676 RepID=A0A3B0X8J8_9ZZZZ